MTQEQFYADFGRVNDFYAAQEGLQRPGGMVIDRDGVPTCDVEAMGAWGWALSQGTPLSQVLLQIRSSDEWKQKHAGDPVAVPPPFEPLPRLCVRGKFFACEDGAPWTMVECSDFNLPGLAKAGGNVDLIFQQRQACGFNAMRWFTAYNVPGIGRLVPDDALYDVLANLIDRAHHFGIRPELVAFTGPYEGLFADEAAMLRHWDRLRELPIDFLEAINESDNPANKGVPLDKLIRPSGILSSHGSNCADEQGVTPFWDYSSYHSNDLSEWWRKTGHNSMERADLDGVPYTANENTRMPDNDANPIHAEDASRAAALLCAGSCFHSVRGKTSELWDGQELVCAQAWARGARDVPLEFQQGQYHHRQDLEAPGIIRAYDRTLSDGRQFTVAIRA